MSIYLGGSRSLAPAPIVGQVVRAVLASGQSVHVGCALGADRQVIQAALGLGEPSSLVVFAAFARGGPQSAPGAWSGSAVCSVYQAACAGASVRWLAGGALAVPLVARLMRRSQAALAGCSASVFFQPGPGSLAVAGCAVAAGQPVFAFTSSFNAPAPAAPRGCAGQWVRSFFHPVCLPAYQQGIFPRSGWACWRWAPSAVQQSLF